MKKTIIFILILLLVGTIAYLFYKEGTLPVNKTGTESKIFVVSPGESLDSVINKLAQEGLIRNRVVFYLVVKQMGIEKKIQAGSFRLKPSLDAYQIADSLTHGTLDVWVTIPEGLRKEEIAALVSKELNISEIEFIELAEEGYLFPDTYLIPQNSSNQNIIQILRTNFEIKYTDGIQSKAKKLGLTQAEVVTLASIVEREAKFEKDRQIIASILLKRLEEGIPLQVDATVQYVLGYQPAENRWWKKHLSLDDLKIKSPYNTYENVGLPPGPISNPGLSSIEAVVNANPDTPYLLYIHDSSGKAHYARNNAEHEANIKRYLK